MRALFRHLRGILVFGGFTLNTILCFLPILVLAVIKLLIPVAGIRRGITRILMLIGEIWISINSAILDTFASIDWQATGLENLRRDEWYLILSNHLAWVDILVLQKVFNKRIPFLKFFIKQELVWFPILGIAWWALDMPFMKRHSREQLARKPGLKGRDLENARKACEKFRTIPVAMTNFPEGTRFSAEKRDQRNSSYQNLLQPRIGGLGQVLFALANQLDALIDVTIIYPQTTTTNLSPTFWQFLTGGITDIIVRAKRVEIPKELLGRNFRTDRDFRRELEAWVDQLWRDKDKLISETLGTQAFS